MPASTAARLLDGARMPAFDGALDVDAAIERIATSGLRGRGGAGFPLADKLRAVREREAGLEAYVVANAYDADPGSPLARTLLERRGDLVVRGIEIAMRIVGATRAFLYLHPEAAEARGAAEAALAGRADIEIALGPGGFMGGEESALLNVLESKRAMARQRPPYPALQGYLMRPTLVSSIETLAWLPLVLDGAGADTKLVSVTGAVKKPGVYEVDLGTALGAILDRAGGAISRPFTLAVRRAGSSPRSDGARASITTSSKRRARISAPVRSARSGRTCAWSARPVGCSRTSRRRAARSACPVAWGRAVCRASSRACRRPLVATRTSLG
jgi:NADH:ubiquinone oxidoreductase subunit F (NADH-binding)